MPLFRSFEGYYRWDCYNFPDYCLTSGGSAYFTDGYSNAHTENGPWKVDKWPDNFPEEYKEETLAAINSLGMFIKLILWKLELL